MPADPPLTPRAQGTRDKLLRTARELFEREGYDATSVSRIVDGADVSRGTFYLYFESKRAIFTSLVEEIGRGLVELQAASLGEGRGPAQVVRHAVTAYVAFYRDHARMMAVLEQLAAYDPECRALRLEMRRTVAERAVRFIAHLQRLGLADPELDPRYAAVALTGMVDRFVYVWLVLGEELEADQAVDMLSRLWVQATGARLGADGELVAAGRPSRVRGEAEVDRP